MPTYRNLISHDSDPENVAETAYLWTILGGAESQLQYRRTPVLFDDFLNPPTLSTSNWTGTADGTTGNDVPVAAVADTACGEITMASGSGALEAQEVAGAHIAWIPSTMGPLVMEVRAKFVGATEPIDGDFALGFADAVTYTGSNPFILSAASAYTTDLPVEFAGFNYTSLATSGALYNSAAATPIGNFIGVKTCKNGTGTAAVSSGIAKNSLYKTYKVTVSNSGLCKFYIDHIQVGESADAAVTVATAVTPYIQVHTQASHENTATIDYIYVGAAKRP